MQTAKVETRQMEEEKEATEVKCKDAERERDQLKKLDELRAAFEAYKKELEEVRIGFVAEKKMLTGDFQKQVDEMFFYGYQCCMRKNGIT